MAPEQVIARRSSHPGKTLEQREPKAVPAGAQPCSTRREGGHSSLNIYSQVPDTACELLLG